MTVGLENITLFVLLGYSFLYLWQFLYYSVKLLNAEKRREKSSSVDDWDDFLSSLKNEETALNDWIRVNIKWSGAIFVAATCYFVFSHALEVLSNFLTLEKGGSNYWLLFLGWLLIGLTSVPVTLFSSLGLATIFGNLLLPETKPEPSDPLD